jgi:hypothetical protein
VLQVRAAVAHHQHSLLLLMLAVIIIIIDYIMSIRHLLLPNSH